MKNRLQNYFKNHVKKILPEAKTEIEKKFGQIMLDNVCNLNFETKHRYYTSGQDTTNEKDSIIYYYLIKDALDETRSVKTKDFFGVSIRGDIYYQKEELRNKLTEEYKSKAFYGNAESYSDLEINVLKYSILEKSITSDSDNKILSFFLREPITDKSFLKYIQNGVKELVASTDLRKNLDKIYNTNNSEEGRDYDYDKEDLSDNNLGREKIQYLTKYANLEKALATANSEVLKDIREQFSYFSNLPGTKEALEIFNKKDHRIVFKEKKEGQICSTYILGKKKISLFSPWELHKNHSHGSINLYHFYARNVEEAINKVLAKNPKESFKDASFSNNFLIYLRLLSGLAKTYEKKGFPYVFPEISDSGKGIEYKNSYNPVLALMEKNSVKNVVPNDLSLKDDSLMYLIAGLNAGGKTTLLKQAGQLSVLAQIGAPIPATEANISLLSKLYTHFPKTESLIDGRSRFIDEIDRIKHILTYADKDSMILLDEPVAGTSVEDAYEVSQDVVRALATIGGPTVYTTHIHDLQKAVAEDNNTYSGCKNMKVYINNISGKIVNSYKIVPGVAERSHGVARAKEILSVDEILKNRR